MTIRTANYLYLHIIKFNSTLGYPGEGPAEIIKIVTLNIGQDPHAKFPKVLNILQQEDIDIALIQETGTGYKCDMEDYSCFQTESGIRRHGNRNQTQMEGEYI
jgi:hypothetical protein